MEKAGNNENQGGSSPEVMGNGLVIAHVAADPPKIERVSRSGARLAMMAGKKIPFLSSSSENQPVKPSDVLKMCEAGSKGPFQLEATAFSVLSAL